ncbi:MAG: peptidase prolyl oligopeptidase active site domain protein [Ferruginibacter sp.]|uniref:S9 family peptidase n=1 Tax=Ferruginibacter sp. TaxID=1940288 RepID=UPI00265B2A51|nr:S9 family peptidase [Ferruginibacter sp.]MDB5280820.1 peptidase prolyl oligopeptidase active site domain protein [Ferruginibacter sp.]
MSEVQNIVKHTLTIDDLQHLRMVSGASLSADGKLLAYVTTKVVMEENAHKDFITIIELSTKKEINVWEGSAPQWSPVANEVAYLADHNGVNYIWIYSADKAISKPLAPVYESHYFMGHLAIKNFAWSPNGQHIAYVSADAASIVETADDNVKVIDRLLYKTKGGRGRPLITDEALSHLWVADVNAGETRLITAGEYNEHSISWSPDSTQIAFVSNRSENPDNNQLHDLWSADLPSGNITRHTNNFGTVYQPAWSPDGRYIAFLATLNKVSTNDSPAEDTRLYIIACRDGSVRCLTHSPGHIFDRRIEQISWHPKADEIYFTAGSEGTTAIYKAGINAGDAEHVEGKDCHILEYAISQAGDTMCFISTDTTHLTEIFLHNSGTKTSRQVTNNSNSLLQQCHIQEAKTFWFKSFDDKHIQGWVIKPANFNAAEKYPLVLVIHGGPHNMFGYEFEERMQLLSANGYGVLFINPRGSSGYGQAFSNGCVLNWGGGDYKDLMAGVDTAIENNAWINADLLGVTGQSYGGFMTNWIITQTNRFKAALVDGGISNLVSFAGTSLYHSLMEAEFNGSAYDNFSLLWQWSPLRNVKNVTTPTLIVHGQADNEVPLSQAEEMYVALKKMGVESTMVQYTGEGHGWRPDLTPHNRYDLLQRTINWFGKYLVKTQL